MATTTYIAEIGTPSSTPELALSTLRNRIKAIEHRGDDGVRQIGQAWDFALMEIGSPARVALTCRVSIDEEQHDAIKHRLTDGREHLFIDTYPLLGAVGP